MEFLILGFFTGLSLILAIGAQNIFVIEQGLKKQYVFLVCLVCSVSDFLLIFLGILLFHYFQQYFSTSIELLLNVLLIIFLIYFIYSKIRTLQTNVNLSTTLEEISLSEVLFKTLGFTYLNAHVYSDTVFFLGNFSKNFLIKEKVFFGIGASIASLIFFFLIGYLSNYFSKFAQRKNTWKYINIFVIGFMSMVIIYVVKQSLSFL